MQINISVIGLGYVGLPLAIELSKFFNVTGYDLSSERIKELKNNYDNTREISAKILKKKKLKLTNNTLDIKNCNFYIITVPTPVLVNKKPDLSNIISATNLVAKFLKKKDIVVYESTVYPGVTEDVCGKILEKKSNLICNKDFFLGYSPERINPGDKKRKMSSIIKVISASNNKTLKTIKSVYKKIIKAGVYQAKTIKIAEAAKVIENTQRDLNIAFVNELKIIFDKIKIDTFEVLKAASTKWNFLNFKPGMVGGHCIGVDPYYLTYLSKKNKINPRIILSGREINDSMWKYYYMKINKVLLKKNIKKTSQRPKILIMGATFKENCPDFRNSQVINLIHKLNKNYFVDIYDPYIDKIAFQKKTNFSLKLNIKKLGKYDLIFISVGHKCFLKLGINFLKKHLKNSSYIMDIKNIFNQGELVES